MANGIYAKGREAFATGLINWPSDDIRLVLVDTAAYTVNLATHTYLSDVAVGSRVATLSASLGSKSATDGILNAASATLNSVTGPTAEALVFYKHTGTDSTARLLLYIDTMTGLPVTPNGGNIILNWDTGTNKIAKL